MIRELVRSVSIHSQSVEIRFRTSGCAQLIEEIRNANG